MLHCVPDELQTSSVSAAGCVAPREEAGCLFEVVSVLQGSANTGIAPSSVALEVPAPWLLEPAERIETSLQMRLHLPIA